MSYALEADAPRIGGEPPPPILGDTLLELRKS